MSFNKYIETLHKHHEIDYQGTPRRLDSKLFRDRWFKLHEEMNEIARAENYGMFDNLVQEHMDLITIALGNLQLMGIDIDAGMEELLKANMAKEVGTNPKRPDSVMDLIKPEGWAPPNISQFCKIENYGLSGVVVLEGADNTGKTTLANYLVEHFGAYYVHHTWNEQLHKNFEQYMMSSFAKIGQISLSQLVVVDRAWVSHEVYGKALGVYEPTRVQEIVSPMIEHMDAVNIMCLGDDAVLQKRHEESNSEEMWENNYKVSRMFNLIWGAGVKGINKGKPLGGKDRYVSYNIEKNGADIGHYFDTVLADNPQLKHKPSRDW